jgi:hypothetical protein
VGGANASGIGAPSSELPQARARTPSTHEPRLNEMDRAIVFTFLSDG